MGRKEVVKEQPLEIVSVITQVDISRRVSRFKLQLRGQQESRVSRRGVEVTDPHRWRGDGAWMRRENEENIVESTS